MKLLPAFYRDAANHVSDSPSVFHTLLEPTTNLAIWERSVGSGLSPELIEYTEDLRAAKPPVSYRGRTHKLPLANGETLALEIERCLLGGNFRYLKRDIKTIANSFIKNVGLPVTFYPEDGGASDVRYLQLSSIYSPEKDYSHFGYASQLHQDSAPNFVPSFAPESEGAPSFAVTIIANYLPLCTAGIRGEYVASLIEKYQVCRYTESELPWKDALSEITNGRMEDAFENFGRYNVVAFAALPRDPQGEIINTAEQMRIFAPHAAPFLPTNDDPRLTLILRAQVGGFIPK